MLLVLVLQMFRGLVWSVPGPMLVGIEVAKLPRCGNRYGLHKKALDSSTDVFLSFLMH